MATLVIHGTMTGAGPSHSTWWWNSRHKGGFLDALAGGITDTGAADDVWRVAGRPVHEIPELRQRGLAQHQGHFQWSGTDMPDARRAGGEFLAAYINRILQISPREPIRLVAHSHGCNVVKSASAVPLLSLVARFPRVVFLACPHFMGAGPSRSCLPSSPLYKPFRAHPQPLQRLGYGANNHRWRCSWPFWGQHGRLLAARRLPHRTGFGGPRSLRRLADSNLGPRHLGPHRHARSAHGVSGGAMARRREFPVSD